MALCRPADESFVRRYLEKDYRSFIFDFDGVLVPHRGSVTNVNVNEKDHGMDFVTNPKANWLYRPCKSIKQFIESFERPDRIFVVGATNNSCETRVKEEFVHSNYSIIPKENIFWVRDYASKVELVEKLYESAQIPQSPYYKKWGMLGKFEICMVDDIFAILQAFEDAGYAALHNSEFL